VSQLVLEGVIHFCGGCVQGRIAGSANRLTVMTVVSELGLAWEFVEVVRAGV